MRKTAYKKRVLLSIVTFIVTAALLTSCGRKSDSASHAMPAEGYAAPGESWEENYSDWDATEAAYDEYVEAEEAITSADASSEMTLKDDKLVYTCHLEMQTLTYTDSAAAIRKTVKKYSGIIEAETETNDGYNWSDIYWYEDDESRSRMDLYLTVRVPVESYEAFVEEVGGIAKVISKTQNTDNISRVYYDTETHIKALEVEQERLLAMMESAETIEEMILVEERLTEVQNELNYEKRWMAEMDTAIAYSTVTIDLREVREYSDSGLGYTEPSFGERVKAAFADAWEGFLGFLENALYVIIHLLPFIIIGLVVFFIIRFKWKRRKAKRAAKNAEPNAGE